MATYNYKSYEDAPYEPMEYYGSEGEAAYSLWTRKLGELSQLNSIWAREYSFPSGMVYDGSTGLFYDVNRELIDMRPYLGEDYPFVVTESPV